MKIYDKERYEGDKIFHDHIKSHFEKEHPDWNVICKICNKTYDEIVKKAEKSKELIK